jgi:hypothetical protein
VTNGQFPDHLWNSRQQTGRAAAAFPTLLCLS